MLNKVFVSKFNWLLEKKQKEFFEQNENHSNFETKLKRKRFAKMLNFGR